MASVPAATEPDPRNLRYDATTPLYGDLPTFPTRPSYREHNSSLQLSTQCVVFEGAPDDPHKPSSVPIYQTATFVQPSATEFGAYDYTRSGNPTRTALEKQVAMLEGAHAAFAFGSGMAALVAVTRLLKAGDELLVGDDIYGGMHRLVSRVTSALHGVTVRFVDTTSVDALVEALSPATRMVHMETPSNPMMRISDIRALVKALAPRRVLLSIDSTMMSPILQRPLSLGADIVVHSATKFFGGHSDVMGGLVCLRDAELSKRIAFFQNAEGSGLDPQSCWLFLRGIKTLALRIERAQYNAVKVAHFLRGHAIVKDLYYPGLEPRAGDTRAARDYATHFSQASGGSCVLSFTTGSMAVSRRVIDALRIFKLTVSFGSVSSLCEMPCFLSHASIPADKRTLPVDLIRLSVGIEAIEDILADLAQAFDLALHPHVVNVRSVRRRDTDETGELEAFDAAAGSASGVLGEQSPAHLEDAATVARAEGARLEGINRVLLERLAAVEASTAAGEAARRASGGSGRGGGSSSGSARGNTNVAALVLGVGALAVALLALRAASRTR